MNTVEKQIDSIHDAVLVALQDSSPRKLTNKEIYELPVIANLLVNYQDNKSRSGRINKVIEELKERGENICGKGKDGWGWHS